MTARACVIVVAALVGSAVPAWAQSSAPSLRAHEILISGGASWAGGYDIGESLASLRTNATGAQTAPFTLFAVSSRMEPLAGVEGHVGYALTPTVLLEGGVWFARANIAVALSRDPEALARSIDGEKLHQFVVSGGVVWQTPWTLGRNLAPFVSAGGGLMRQLHEERTLAEDGRMIYAGGGARYFIKGGHGSGRSVGVRGDLRLAWRSPGIDFEDKTRVFPTVSVLLFAGF